MFNITSFNIRRWTKADIVTAVSTEWLLDEYTTFPVYIDPSVAPNIETSPSQATGFGTCIIEDVDCFSQYDGRYEHGFGSPTRVCSMVQL